MLNVPSHNWGNVESPWITVRIDTWEALLQGRTPTEYPAKSNVFWQGKACSSIYIVAEGRVAVSLFHKDGQQKQLYTACSGALIGEEDGLISRPRATTATAITKCEIYAVPIKDLQNLHYNNKAFAQRLLQYLASKSRMMIAQSAMLSFDNAKQRIAKMLLYICDEYGMETSEGILLDVRFTCDEIAALVNTSRVTVNNTLLEFTRQGILKRTGRLYTISDIEQMKSIATYTM